MNMDFNHQQPVCSLYENAGQGNKDKITGISLDDRQHFDLHSRLWCINQFISCMNDTVPFYVLNE